MGIGHALFFGKHLRKSVETEDSRTESGRAVYLVIWIIEGLGIVVFCPV